MPDPADSITDFETICRQAAAAQEPGTGNDRASDNQVYFFALVWWLKKGGHLPPPNPLSDPDITAVTERAKTVVQHLSEWGAVVSSLQQRDEKEWEMLRIQMDRAIRYYPCHPPQLKADALQEALMKVFRVLHKMPDGRTLDETHDMMALVLKARQDLTNIYDFGSPFYAFAKRVTRNQLISQLRKQGRDRTRSIFGAEMENIPAPDVIGPQPEVDDKSSLRLQLKIDLAVLLEIVGHDLPPKRRQVILYTFAARPQFWRALEKTGLDLPDGIPQEGVVTSDAHIAQALKTTENNVRVHRREARKQVDEIDRILGLLFESLVAGRGSAAAAGAWRRAKG
jgi:DNA-directed RNA polymerase specialized sigma24 family protein